MDERYQMIFKGLYEFKGICAWLEDRWSSVSKDVCLVNYHVWFVNLIQAALAHNHPS